MSERDILEQQIYELDTAYSQRKRTEERAAVEKNRPPLLPDSDDTLSIWMQDCIQGMPEKLGAESVDLIVTSIPFSNLFSYSGKNEDVGNSWDGTDSRDSHFGLHMRFVVEQMLSVLRPGCIAAIHVQQLLTTKVQHGHMGRRDFRGAVVDLFSAGGFQWVGEVGIPKNPQAMAQRQKLHSLLFVTGMRDGRALAPAVNDYVLIFRKPGEGAPVRCLYDAQKNPGGWLTREEWIRDAHGIWTDIQETDTLEGWRTAGDKDDEKHVCPLQLEVIRRMVKLYTSPGDIVLDPFMGIGSTAYVALEQGRRARGFELKESYHRQGLKNARKAIEARETSEIPQLTLFDMLDEPAAAPEAAEVA